MSTPETTNTFQRGNRRGGFSEKPKRFSEKRFTSCPTQGKGTSLEVRFINRSNTINRATQTVDDVDYAQKVAFSIYAAHPDISRVYRGSFYENAVHKDGNDRGNMCEMYVFVGDYMAFKEDQSFASQREVLLAAQSAYFEAFQQFRAKRTPAKESSKPLLLKEEKKDDSSSDE